MTKTKTDNGTTAIEGIPPQPVLTLDDLRREKARYEVAYQQLLDNANANAGVIQFLTMQIERLEKETEATT